VGTIASDRNFAIGFDGRLFHFVAGVMREEQPTVRGDRLPRRKNEGDVIGRREDRSVAISQGSRNLWLARRDKKSLFRGGPLMRVLSRQVDEKRGSGPGLIESRRRGNHLARVYPTGGLAGGRRRRFVISRPENWYGSADLIDVKLERGRKEDWIFARAIALLDEEREKWEKNEVPPSTRARFWSPRLYEAHQISRWKHPPTEY